MDTVKTWIENILKNTSLLLLVKMLIIVSSASILYFISRKIMVHAARKAVGKTRNRWDDYLYEHGFFNRLSLLVPWILLYSTSSYFGDFEELIKKISNVALIFVSARVLSLFIEALFTGVQKKQGKGRSLSGIIQAGKLLVYLVAIILVAGLLMEKSPTALLSGIGAMTAILTLVFKDTILSLVASVQFSLNKTLKLGDWVEIPEMGADGDVVDITLHNVMVQNWDKTLITIPTHRFLEQGFKNWKGMSEAGGRRIKRSILIDLRSVAFLSEEKLEELKKIQILKDFLEKRKMEIEEDNRNRKVDPSSPVNGRAMTNIGVFRAYAQAYLEQHQAIRKDMTLMVRQLEPTEKGLPLQIYCFTADTVWAHYESIQADIFDHLMAAIPCFGLSLYQNPSGEDLSRFIRG